MHPLAERIWLLVTDDDWEADPQLRLERSRGLWGEHGYGATWMATTAAITTWNQLAMHGADGAEMVEIHGRGPEGPVRSVLGTPRRSGEVIEATIRLVAAVQDGSETPIDGDLKRIDRDFKGSAVYMFAWWARAALGQLMDRVPPAERDAKLGAVRDHFEELSTPEG